MANKRLHIELRRSKQHNVAGQNTIRLGIAILIANILLCRLYATIKLMHRRTYITQKRKNKIIKITIDSVSQIWMRFALKKSIYAITDIKVPQRIVKSL